MPNPNRLGPSSIQRSLGTRPTGTMRFTTRFILMSAALRGNNTVFAWESSSVPLSLRFCRGQFRSTATVSPGTSIRTIFMASFQQSLSERMLSRAHQARG
ncbi:unnamed protein product [Prorocentrum cordatum]|uniref:Uncharacterized protein n=1 Tax=Prorocentrum cordatum TaxID=2364126 RepID=A0ABN9WNQ0_9DINO|nr:unnamed protein product [Polarella glacialis]